ncbi:unnamed protein product [Tetraodon nigroviridis]|uniref:(spotted green pufferfish) hypothetical protein n=1 Tax=Tetraodon nigroviridis TaxID=99883 RepID=Q4RKA3_TETNG|nr:unnamed protein product [Tetraodon nigroviridis]
MKTICSQTCITVKDDTPRTGSLGKCKDTPHVRTRAAVLGGDGEMQLFRPVVLHHRGFSDESPKSYQTDAFEDDEDFQTQNLASAALLVEDEEFAQVLMKDGPEVSTEMPEFMEITNRQSSSDGANNGPGSSAGPESPQRLREVVEPSQNSEVYFESGEPGDPEHDGDAKTAEHRLRRHQEDPTAYVLQLPQMVDQVSEVCFHHVDDASKEVSAMNTPDDSTHCRDVSSVESIQSEEISSQSISESTPETVTSARHFSFEEVVLDPYLAPPRGASEYFGLSVTTKSEMMSNSEEHRSPSGGADTVGSPRSTDERAKIEHRGEGSPGVDCSDPEGYFDCKQAASDLSEPDEPHPRDCPGSVRMPTEKVLLSSESEEYEDAPFVQEPLRPGHEDSEERARSSEPSDDEFTLCEASQPPAACSAGDRTDNCLPRADDFPEFATQSVTEEKYRDENGHIVVKKITRKIIRKCVSAEADREEVSFEGDAFAAQEEGGYPKVVKRTVLKSEGGHTEVTFTESEGFATARQETVDECKMGRVERSVVVEGKRTLAQHSGQRSASDPPSAQGDFKQRRGDQWLAEALIIMEDIPSCNTATLV